MASALYNDALARVLVAEGGYVNDPDDPGGATMRGVTQRVYDGWRRARKLAPQPVRRIAEDELADIYRRQYADKVRFADLPAGLDYVVFDGAVHSGPAQSVKWLQRALGGVKVDGLLGEATLDAAREHPDHDALIAAIIGLRRLFLRALKGWGKFGRGWERRVADVLAGGQAWASGSVPDPAEYVTGAEAPARAADAALPASPISGPTAGAAGGGVAVVLEQARQQIEPYAGTSSIVSTIFVGLTVAAAVVAVGGVAYGLWARRRRAQVLAAIGDEPAGSVDIAMVTS